MKGPFDILFENTLDKGTSPAKSISDILFADLPGRSGDSKIILSHFENQYVEITLDHLRAITLKLIRSLDEKQIVKGQTVTLLTFQGCNEMVTALLFIALAVKGCRTFLPMYSESAEFREWLDVTRSENIILPGCEIMSLDGHEREKSEIREISNMAKEKGIPVWDTLSDFGIDDVLFEKDDHSSQENPFYDPHQRGTTADDEVLIVTTSGTSGKSRLVVYTHKAYYLNCLAWEQAGLYRENFLGGTGFTPLLVHTMGIRALINALWTGMPVCLIITEWFLTKPETVRYLLLKMRPCHITGGPAVYRTFLELCRVFPEIKAFLGKNLKTLVSSGAAYNKVTAGEVFNAFGLRLHNAFGTTETQQVFSTLLSSESILDQDLTPLGSPLPGVSVGLIRTDTEQNYFRLYIKSDFCHKYCIGEDVQNSDGYFDTGDIVFLDTQNYFYHVGRSNLDYFKDSFGVKIPIRSIRSYYQKLTEIVLHAEFYPLADSPGLAALLFIRDDSLATGLLTENRNAKKFSGIVEEINDSLVNTIAPFEFQHRHLSRIAVINQSPPLTGKGTISVKQINSDFRELIERLKDTRKESFGIETTDSRYQASDKYTRFLSPKLGTLMSALKLNYSYHRGEKDTLSTWLHGKEIEILDVTGGYGTNLAGYNNPDISRAVKDFISSGQVAICNQFSIQSHAALLAEKLNLIVGSETGRSYRVVFGNSGSEAVEIAIHHAFMEWEKRTEKFRDQQMQMYGASKSTDVSGIWQRNAEIISKARIKIIALTNSFHGHSTGARSILGNRKKRLKFSGLANIEAVFMDDRSANSLEMIRAAVKDSEINLERIAQVEGEIKIVPYKLSTIIAAVAEPVMGEGGVRVVNKKFLEELSMFEFPLISDEIQCGLYRTGEMPECKCAHYFLFGKALGGGIEKISAVLIDKSRYCADFSEYYTSTFGNGELAAVAGMSTLELISEDGVIQKIRETGNYLHGKLSDLKKKYPSVIQDVLGKGLMQAVYFNPECITNNIFLRVLFETEKAGYLFTAWLLNRHHIRMFPTISAPFALRLEPSAFFTREESDRVFLALDELCSIISKRQMYELYSFLMDDDTFTEPGESREVLNFYNQTPEYPAEKAVKTAFIAHFAFPLKELRMFEPDFLKASDTGLRILFRRLQILLEMDPVKMFALNLFKGKVHFTVYVIPVDSSELESLHKSAKRNKIVAKIQKAVNLAAENGAEIISLGGYTSILTNNGLSLLEPSNSRIITGNTLTAASGLFHLIHTIKQSPDFNKTNLIAIIGSTGNIGRVITEMLCDRKDLCSGLLLVSRSERQAVELIHELENRITDAVKMKASNNMNDIKTADIIIICSNTNDPIIFTHHIAGDKAVLISDLSVPSAVSSEVSGMPNVTVLPFSAWVTLPEDEQAVISSFSPPGTVFCCAAEAMLLGLEPFDGSLKGKILPEDVGAMSELAHRHNLFKHTGNIDTFKTSRI